MAKAKNLIPTQSASVPFMVTRKMEADLLKLGYGAQEIGAMRPAEAQSILQQSLSAGVDQPPMLTRSPEVMGRLRNKMTSAKVTKQADAIRATMFKPHDVGMTTDEIAADLVAKGPDAAGSVIRDMTPQQMEDVTRSMATGAYKKAAKPKVSAKVKKALTKAVHEVTPAQQEALLATKTPKELVEVAKTLPEGNAIRVAVEHIASPQEAIPLVGEMRGATVVPNVSSLLDEGAPPVDPASVATDVAEARQTANPTYEVPPAAVEPNEASLLDQQPASQRGIDPYAGVDNEAPFGRGETVRAAERPQPKAAEGFFAKRQATKQAAEKVVRLGKLKKAAEAARQAANSATGDAAEKLGAHAAKLESEMAGLTPEVEAAVARAGGKVGLLPRLVAAGAAEDAGVVASLLGLGARALPAVGAAMVASWVGGHLIDMLVTAPRERRATEAMNELAVGQRFMGNAQQNKDEAFAQMLKEGADYGTVTAGMGAMDQAGREQELQSLMAEQQGALAEASVRSRPSAAEIYARLQG